MTEGKDLPSPTWDGSTPRRALGDYSRAYGKSLAFERRNGIIEVRLHTNDGSPVLNFGMHNTWAYAFQDIGNDPENDVMILTSTGEHWMTPDPNFMARGPEEWSAFEHYQLHQDAIKVIENMVHAIDFPSIGAINGPGIHQEMALLCDITLCTPDTAFFDPHFLVGTVPGDGTGLIFQELMGNKRAMYHLYTAKAVSAEEALNCGMVQEIVPRERLLDRAWELAQQIRSKPFGARRFTSALSKRVWKRRLLQDFNLHLAYEAMASSHDKPFLGTSGPPQAIGGNTEDYGFHYHSDATNSETK